ncbi:MAG: DNA repair protein RecO [Eubacterium sp.]|nr:DNA repair protein RecO [Eubacterium sp.]
MRLTTKGLIIKEQTIGESDRLVTLLTAEFGLVKAFVRRAKNLKNQNVSSTSLFVYGDFVLYKGKDAYVIDSASPTEVFFDLRRDIETLALAQYFAQLTYFLGAEEHPAPETLKLVLNALHLLCKNKMNPRQLKAIVEMRMLCLGGYMPNVLACYRCGKFESDLMFFDIEEGCIYCDECFRNNAIAAPSSVIAAIRFICLSDISKVFSFKLGEENLEILADICEKYMLSRIDGKLSTLEFYKTIVL